MLGIAFLRLRIHGVNVRNKREGPLERIRSELLFVAASIVDMILCGYIFFELISKSFMANWWRIP